MIGRIPPPSPLVVDFETIVNNLKRSVKFQPPPATIVDRDDILYSPQPRRLIDLQNFGIEMEILSRECIDEPITLGAKKRHEKHALCEGTTGYHLGLKPTWLT